MSSERPAEQRIREWLDSDSPRRLPDRALETTFRRTRGSAQVSVTPAWTNIWIVPKAAITAVGALVVAGVIVGVALLPGPQRPSVGGLAPPRPSSPATSSAPSPTACEAWTAIGIPFRDGCRYGSSLFGPILSIDGDSRWRVVDEGARGIEIDSSLPGGVPKMEGVGFANIDRLAMKPCQTSGEMTDQSTIPFEPASPGSGPADLFRWIGQKTPLKVPAPKPTTIAGYPGLETTVTIPNGAFAACGGWIWISQFRTDDIGGHWALAKSGLTMRIAAIDVHGATVLVSMWAPPERFTAFEPEAEKLLSTVSLR